MADISEIKSGERDVEIKHPKTKEPVGITVTLVSIDDESLAAERRKIIDRRQYLEARGKTMKAEEIEDNQQTLLFRAVKGWNFGVDANDEQVTFKGEVPEFNRKNFNAVCDTLPWFKSQLLKEFSETEDFFNT